MCPPARRTFLATCGLAVLAAGCLDAGTSDNPTDANTPTSPDGATNTPTLTPGESGGLDLHVAGVKYRTAVLYPTHPDAAAVEASVTNQFVFFSLPEEIVWQSEFEAKIEVSNEGGREERFLGMFGIENTDHPRAVQVTVPPDETRTEVVSEELPSLFEGHPEEPPGSVTYELDTGLGVIEETTSVVEG